MEQASSIEEECSKCHGHGKINNKTCDACNGTGATLTEDGQKLLNFIRDSIRTSEH